MEARCGISAHRIDHTRSGVEAIYLRIKVTTSKRSREMDRPMLTMQIERIFGDCGQNDAHLFRSRVEVVTGIVPAGRSPQKNAHLRRYQRRDVTYPQR